MISNHLTEQVLGGLILAAILWVGGLLFRWWRSRGVEVAVLRKYERLRAKVEVLSRLTSIDIMEDAATGLAQRQSKLVTRELNSVLDELEMEEEAISQRKLQSTVFDLIRPLTIGPSFGGWAILTKILFYLSAFAVVWILFIGLLVAFTPISTGYRNDAGEWVEMGTPGYFSTISNEWRPYPPGGRFSGVLCIASPFLLNAGLWYMIAKLVHRRPVTAEVINPPNSLQ